MKTFQLELTLRSPALIGSGEGFGAVIDTDVVFDHLGIPYIPAKRIKGCLKDSAEQVAGMFRGTDFPYMLEEHETFGLPGIRTGTVYFSNLILAEYQENLEWLHYLTKEYKEHLSPETIRQHFTEIRQQTRINEQTGVAYDHSLRTIRVIKKGYTFCGDIRILSENEAVKEALALACLNLRHIGTKRTRGFGEVKCKLIDTHTNDEVSILDKLEGLCNA